MIKLTPKRERQTVGPLRETVSTVFWAFFIAFILRTFLFQPFHIPSNSMQPILTKGDYIITSKYSVGYGKHAATPLPFPVKEGRLFERKPERGDVIVFRSESSNINLIKRLIGLPGDQLQMISGVLYLNDERIEIASAGQETRLDSFGNEDSTDVQRETYDNGKSIRIYDDLKNSTLDNTGVFTEGGAGYVAAENLIGKAEIVLLSVKHDFSIRKPWTWYKVNGDRFFRGID